MPNSDEIEKLGKRVEHLEEWSRHLKNVFWVAGAIAAVLGYTAVDIKGELSEVEDNTEVLNERVEQLQSRLDQIDAELDEKIAKALKPHVEGAIAQVEAQEADSIRAVQEELIVSDDCVIVASLQTCWGTMSTLPDKSAPHTAGFSFKFGRTFAQEPAIVASVSVKGSGRAAAIYNWSATGTTYNGRVIITDPSKNFTDLPTVSYLAIGRPGS